MARDTGWYPGNYNDAANTRNRYLGSLSNGYRRILAGYEKDVGMSRSRRGCCPAKDVNGVFCWGLECRMDGRLEVIDTDQGVGRRRGGRSVLDAVGLAGSRMPLWVLVGIGYGR
jgi:hypothetical protein